MKGQIDLRKHRDQKFYFITVLFFVFLHFVIQNVSLWWQQGQRGPHGSHDCYKTKDLTEKCLKFVSKLSTFLQVICDYIKRSLKSNFIKICHEECLEIYFSKAKHYDPF